MKEEWLPAEHGTDNRGLRKRVERGLVWTIADTWGRQLLSLVVFIVIARLVSQADVGLVALAAVFVTLAEIFVDQGLSDAIVQRRALSRGHIDTAFWISMLVGVVLALAGVLLAIPISLLVGEPELQPILQVLSVSFVLTALSSVQMGLLRRELAFRSLALRTLMATGGGGLVGVALAFMGYGAWALVGQALAQAALSVVALWRVSPWRPGLKVSGQHFRDLFGFSRNVVAADVLTFLSRYTDNFLIGAFIGTVPLGIYAVGFRILSATSSALLGISRRVGFSALSRLQHDRERMQRAFYKLSRLMGVIVIPGYLGLALVAPELIVVLFGERWQAAGPVAALLFLAGPVIGIQNVFHALLNAAGQPAVVFRLRLFSTIGNVAGFAIAVAIFFDILAVAAAFVLRAYLVMPLYFSWGRRHAGVSAREFLVQLRGIMGATAAMSVAVLAVRLALGEVLGPATLLAVQVLAGAIAFGVALWLLDRKLLGELRETGVSALPLPGRARHRRGRGADDEPAARAASAEGRDGDA
ncbi:lipopolysaccharide biosynthesis protein [soil metagenome]